MPCVPPLNPLYTWADGAALQAVSAVTVAQVTLTRAVGQGDFLVAVTGHNDSTIAVTDSSSNTWVNAGAAGTNFNLFYCLNAAASPSGLTVTATCGAAGTMCLIADRFTVLGRAVFGGFASSTSGGSSGTCGSLSGVPAQALLYGGLHSDTGNQTETAGQSNGVCAATATNGVSNGSGSSFTEYVSATAGGTESMTWSSTGTLSSLGAVQAWFSVTADVIGTWTASRAIGSGTGIPAPQTMPLACPVANTGHAGNGMAALVSWTLPDGYLGADMAVTDDAQPSRNVWWPLGAPQAASPATGFTRSQIWAAPGAFAASNVFVSPCGLPDPCYPVVIGATIVEVTGMSPYLGNPVVVTSYSNAGTVVTAPTPTPASSALLLTVGASDGTVAPSGPGTGWAALTGVSASGGGFNLKTKPAWQVSSLGSYDYNVLLDQPAAWWKLADPVSSAVAVDSSGASPVHNGTPANVTFGVAGIVTAETAAAFNGTTSKVDTALNPVPPLGITVEAWVNLGGVTPASNSKIVANDDTPANNNGFTLGYVPGFGTLAFIVGNGTTFANVFTLANYSGWQHLAGTWDGVTVQLYVNGSPVASAALSGTVRAGSNNIGIGYNPAYSGDFLNGKIAHVAIYGYALSAARILANFNAAPGVAAATWTTSAAADLSAASAVILLSNPAPPQPSADWPAFRFDAGFGAGALTPPGQIEWTDLSYRWLSGAGEPTTATTGKPYELDQLQAAEDTATFDDDDGALTAENQASAFYPDVTVDTPMRLIGWWAGRTYGVLAGLAESWPVMWDEAWFGITEVTMTDPWSLQQNQLQSVLRQEMADPNLVALWPCSDPAGSESAQNVAPGYVNPLSVVTSENGALTATQSFGSSPAAGALAGDQSATSWQQGGLTSGAQGYGFALYCADQAYPELTAGMTVMGWFAPAGATQIAVTPYELILFRGSNAATGPVFQVHLNSPSGIASPGALRVAVWDESTGVETITTCDAGDWLLAGWIHVALEITQGTWALYLNGSLCHSGTCNLPSTVTWLEYMGAADRQFTGGMLNGACEYLGVYSVLLRADRIRSIWLAGTPDPAVTAGGASLAVPGAQFGTEYPAQRIERFLAYGGWTGPRSISQSSTTQMAPISDIQGSGAVISASGKVTLSAGGQQAGQAANNIVFSDGGFLFTDGQGTICYLSRGDLYVLASQWVIGPDTAAGDAPYLPSFKLGFDKQNLYNGALLTPSSSVSAVPVVASNVASIRAHGEYVFNGTAYQDLIAQVADLASWIVSTRGVIRLRAQEITLDAAANPLLWPILLAVQPAQPLTVTGASPTTTYQVTFEPVVSQVVKTLDFQNGVAQAKLTTDQFPEGLILTAGDPILGVADGTHSLGW